MSEYSSFVWSSQNSLEWLIRYINGFVSIGHDIFVTNRSTTSAKGFGYQVLHLPFLSCTLDRKVHLNFKAVRGILTCLVLVYWIINWFYLLLYLFFSSVDLATKTERELWWWWEHCQGAKDDGSHGKDQRSWHQSQVSMLSSTMPWLHSAAVPCSPCKDSQGVHVQPNSKGGSRFFFFLH